jgi:hypothetical protein
MYAVNCVSKNARAPGLSSARSEEAAEHAARHTAADSGRASSARQPAANEGSAAERLSLLQPGRAEYGTGWNAMPGGDTAGTTVRPGGGAGVGPDAHDSSTQTAAALESIAMIWFILEALVALFLAVFIVWFTMGGRRKPPRTPPAAEVGSGKDEDKQ